MANTTFTAIASGNWSNPAIWNPAGTIYPGSTTNTDLVNLGTTLQPVINLDVKPTALTSVSGTGSILPLSGAYTLVIGGMTIGPVPNMSERTSGTGVTATIVPKGTSGT